VPGDGHANGGDGGLAVPDVDPIDEERFNDLAREFSDDVVREVVVAFIDSTPPIIERIVLAAEGADHDEIAAGAHRLKGGCLAVGAGALNDLASELEALGRDAAPADALQQTAGRLERVWMATRRALRDRVR
jgi:HPt (histidine-containing phosphotransfer) domain-containing protein